MHDLLIKGGQVLDPDQGLSDQRDIAISHGKITALARDFPRSRARKVINAEGKLVTPGLIDIHLHLDSLVSRGGLADPDLVGVLSGVTTVCDAGTTGIANFSLLRRLVSAPHRTDVFGFINMGSDPHGIDPEIKSRGDIIPDAILRKVEENRDLIKGIKLRVTGALVENLGIQAVKVSKRVAVEAQLPLMVHIGIPPPEQTPADVAETYTRELLPFLDGGDILSHVFTPHVGGVIRPDGSVLPELREAIQRGVVLEVAHGGRNFAFELARKGLENGVFPAIISTDFSSYTFPNGVVVSLLVTMSKFLALGLSLSEVIEMTTVNSSRALGEQQRRGSLRIGMPADISILELTRGQFIFSDATGDKLKGKVLLVPNLVLKSGVEIATQSRFT